MNDLKTLLNHLPYKLAAYDATGTLLYDNGGADGSFFPVSLKICRLEFI